MAKIKETSVAAIFQNNVARFADRPCTAYKSGDAFADLSWKQMDEKIRNTAYYLLDQGIKKGDKVALFSPNRYEWFVADMAILSIGAVNVPIYATNSPDEALYILENSDSKMCFCGTEDHLDRILKVRKKLPKLAQLIIFEEYSKKKQGVLTLEKAMEKGADYKSKSTFEKRLKAIKGDDLATLIYTSGTTGNPKGVMLTHSNFVSNVKQILADFSDYVTDSDVFLSFLPLSHSLERTSGYYLAMAVGAKIAYAQDFSTIQEDLALVRPSCMISVPRLYEKIHSGLLARVADAPGLKKALFNWSMKVAAKNLPYVCQDKKPGGLLGKKVDLADKLIWSKLKDALGFDRLRLAVSGGGPLAVSDAEFFLGMGIVILEGYGLTETTPVTNVNRPGIIKPGTVGPPLKNTNIKISDEGEILVKGPQVMKGYYKNKAATKEVFTKDNYFRTGDIGIIDELGRLSITGRIKDIIVTAGGKNISPQNIENSLKESKYIEQVAVIGDKRKYLSALIIPAFDELKKWAKRKGVEFTDTTDLIAKSEVNELIGNEIDKYTKNFARVEQIRKFNLLDAEWSQETGELTPTLKIKRRVIDEKYAKEIESMYPND